MFMILINLMMIPEILISRIENLCMNQFMHKFQSSWSDFSDFEKIFVRIKNTISGQILF